MKSILLIYILVCSSFLFGQSLKKGYEALGEYNYFLAKKVFVKKEKKNPALSTFGLALIYHRSDNPFHNIDSAFVKIQVAALLYDSLNPKVKEKYSVFAVNTDSILSLRTKISSQHFKRSVGVNTEDEFVHFIEQHPWAIEISLAEHKRDSLAFLTAERGNTSENYADFLQKYSNSSYSLLAQELFYRTQYDEETVKGREEDFARFIATFPSSPYVSDAELELYNLIIEPHTLEAYTKMIRTYPLNPFVNQAWKLLYRTYIRDFSTTRFDDFITEFPDYPFMDELLREKEVLAKVLLPYQQADKWGFIDKNGTIVIQPKFDGVDHFSEGLAMVQINNKLGYIDGLGNTVIQPRFSEAYSFNTGLAVVANDDDYYGVIDRTGMIVLELSYDEITLISNGFFWVLIDGNYTCYSSSGEKRLHEEYTTVTDFERTPISLVRNEQKIDFEVITSIVSKEETYYLIDTLGRVLLENTGEIKRFGQNFLLTANDSLGIVNVFGDTILAFGNYEIGAPSSGSLVPFSENGKIGFLSSNGEMRIAPKFDRYPNVLVFGRFKNGHAKMYDARTKQFGLIDMQGAWVVPARYGDISFFSDIIAMRKSEFWEFYDVNLRRKWNRRFANAESFSGYSAVIVDEQKYGLFGRDGEFLLEPNYDEIVNLTTDLLRLKDENGFWLADKMGVLKLPVAYDRIEIAKDGILQLVKNDEMDYYLIGEDCIIEVE
jgi:hypothetical protein